MAKSTRRKRRVPKFDRKSGASEEIKIFLASAQDERKTSAQYAQIRRFGASLPHRKRRLRRERVQMIHCLGLALIARQDEATGYVAASYDTLADFMCLKRVRKDGKPEIKRVREAALQMQQMELIEIHNGPFNPETGCYDSSMIIALPLLYQVYGDYSGQFYGRMKKACYAKLKAAQQLKPEGFDFEAERRRLAHDVHQKRLNVIRQKMGARHSYDSSKILELKRRVWACARQIGEAQRKLMQPKPRATGWTMAASIVTELRRDRTLPDALKYAQAQLASLQNSATTH